MHELRRVLREVTADAVGTREEFSERFRLQTYDVILAQHPNPHWGSVEMLELLQQSVSWIPLIFVTGELDLETVADLTSKGAADCVQIDYVGHLPVAIRHALDQKNVRVKRERAEKELRHSEARYRALAGNLTFGICRCGPDGTLLEVNQALVTMLGYFSHEELLAVDFARDVIRDPQKRAQVFGQSGVAEPADSVEIEWTRKDGTPLRALLSGREITGETGETDGHEIIVEDVTKQRELEDHLRKQAARDPLTGLANYRHLVDVLDLEIKRSKRTGREFALLMFDMDSLKQVNDRYGHMTGNKALCRLADVLCLSCREIDTAARFGGDEFALVLPETGSEAAKNVALRICKSLEEDGDTPQLSVSVGTAVYPDDAKEINTLLCAADTIMYAIKGLKIAPPQS